MPLLNLLLAADEGLLPTKDAEVPLRSHVERLLKLVTPHLIVAVDSPVDDTVLLCYSDDSNELHEEARSLLFSEFFTSRLVVVHLVLGNDIVQFK